MPVMDGYEACKLLKHLIKSNKIRKCSIVACTGALTDDNIEMCERAGFDSVLGKPIDNVQLKDLVRQSFIN